MSETRFQDSNWLVKVWRYRWYIPIPFKWLWYTFVMKFKVYEHGSPMEYEVSKGKQLWSILIGDAQIKMKWYHTHEEVMADFDERFKWKGDGEKDW
jgi:hypothetical protein